MIRCVRRRALCLRNPAQVALIALLILAILPILAGCGSGTPSGMGPTVHSGKSSRAAYANADLTTITVKSDAGIPLSGAEVMIGAQLNSPFPGNLVVTDSSGQAAVPSDWIDAQPVTIEAKGFIRSTYFARLPSETNFSMRRAPSGKSFEVKGETTGYPDLSVDGFVDVGLVFPTLERSQSSTLQIASLVSTETDSMTLLGRKVEIPSNIAIPTQIESYVLPLTFSKPGYRIYFDQQRTYTVATINARFPLEEVVDDIQDKVPFAELINKFTFVGGSLKSINVKGSSTTISLPVNELKFVPAVQVVAPSFDPKLTMVAIALPEASGKFFISDVKRLLPKQKLMLAAPKSAVAKGLVVNVLSAQLAPKPALEILAGAKNEQLSAVMTPANRSQAIEFLPLVDSPQLRSGALVLDVPRKPQDLAALLTYALLSRVEIIEKGKYKVEKKIPHWEVYAPSWSSRLDLPQAPPSWSKIKGDLRWEATFAGQREGNPVVIPIGPETLEKATHVTRSAVDL